MWGKKRISAMLMAVIVSVSAGMSQTVTYAEPTTDNTAAATDAATQQALTPEQQAQQEEQNVYNMEVQSNGWENWPQGPGTYGEAAIVMDAGTGSILYAKNIDEHEYPASITKVLTSLVAFKYGKLTDNVTFSNDCISFMQPGDSSVGLKEGNVISLEQALYATLLASANEAAYAVAENVGTNAGHDYNWFIEQMNEECKKLGGNNSNFVNANGLHDDNHYTCARDMALIGREVWRYPEFTKICKNQSYTIPATATTEEHVFAQHHKMLIDVNKNYYEYAVAGKTGYTSNALSTLITMADNGNMKLVCVVLRTHGVHIYTDTRELFEYAFNNFQKVNVAEQKKPEGVKEFISAGESKEAQTLEKENLSGNEYHVQDDGYVLLPNGVEFSDVKHEVTDVDQKSGEGTIKYTYDGHEVGSATAVFTKSYLKKLSDEEKSGDSKSANVDNSENNKSSGGKHFIKQIESKIQKAWKLYQKKYYEKPLKVRRIIAAEEVLLVVLILAFIISLLRRRK